MNKQELIEYCKSLKGDLNKFINGIDVNKIIAKIEQLDEPQEIVVQQFVADWIEYCKNTGLTLKQALMLGEVYFYSYANQEDFTKLKEFLKVKNNQELFARAWLDGYEVEKEKWYTVKMRATKQPLFYNNMYEKIFFSLGELATRFTRKELEEAGFGEVFNSPLFEVEEVE